MSYNFVIIINKRSLDISENKIEDPEILPQILEKMPKLAVLYLHGNEVTKKI